MGVVSTESSWKFVTAAGVISSRPSPFAVPPPGRFFNGYSISGTAHSPTARTPAPLVSDDARVAVRVATLARVTSNPRRVVNASRGVRERTLPRARPARRIHVVGSSDTNGRAARPR